MSPPGPDAGPADHAAKSARLGAPFVGIVGGQQPSVWPSSVGQQFPAFRPSLLQLRFMAHCAETAWGTRTVLFNAEQQPR